ncbi:hypothetical protein COOONC_05629, partial [Cooperia oncophora]
LQKSILLDVNIFCFQWSRLFFGISVIVVASNIPFVFVARSEPAPWTGNKITSPSLAQTAYTVAIVSSGINAVGTIKCAQMVARQHVHVVMAVTSFLLCVIVLVIPLAVNIVCPDNTPEQVPSSPLVL